MSKYLSVKSVSLFCMAIGLILIWISMPKLPIIDLLSLSCVFIGIYSMLWWAVLHVSQIKKLFTKTKKRIIVGIDPDTEDYTLLATRRNGHLEFEQVKNNLIDNHTLCR